MDPVHVLQLPTAVVLETIDEPTDFYVLLPSKQPMPRDIVQILKKMDAEHGRGKPQTTYPSIKQMDAEHGRGKPQTTYPSKQYDVYQLVMNNRKIKLQF